MRRFLVAAALALSLLPAAQAQVSVSIGINVPAYPQLVRVPGYPVYYDPRASTNYFFYDGQYWVFIDDNWYASDWYNGPWRLVGPEYVPVYVLRVPVRYYRYPPPYFRSWSHNAPPHWGERWGPEWERRRGGWDRWDHRAAPAPAPLPLYQRQYHGERYPHAIDQQQSIRDNHYRYQPRDPVMRQQLAPPVEQPRAERMPPPAQQVRPAPQVQHPPREGHRGGEREGHNEEREKGHQRP